MNEYNDLISVIVPIYNVSEYLRRCLDSIVGQSYKRIEIILVNDGSTDNSGEICKEYAQKDNRIKIIEKQNGGLSEARNYGINIAKGNYITFVDSDDWLEEEYIEVLYKCIYKEQCDVSICDFYNITSSKKILNKYMNNEYEYVYKGKEALIELLKAEKFSTSAWGKLYKRSLFLERRYPVGKIYEDIPVTYDIFLSDIKAIFIAKPLYNYFYRNNAISKMSFSVKRLDAINFMEDIGDRVIAKYPELRKFVEIRLFSVYFNTYLTFNREKEFLSYKKEIKKKIRKYRLKVLFSNISSKQMKRKAIISVLNLNLIKKILYIRKEYKNENKLK